MQKLFTIKEAKKILGVCTKTIQRWDRAGKIRCVRTPGGRRRIPESEILRIRGKIEFQPTPQPQIEPVRKPEARLRGVPATAPPVKKPEKAAPPTELPRYAILDKLAAAGLAQRGAFGDLLSAAAVLRTFTIKELSVRARCPESITKTFCERMASRGFLTSKNEGFELRVRLIR